MKKLPTAVEALKSYPIIDPIPDLHPDNNGERNYLLTCEVRDQARGVTFFGRTNCNVLLFPSGLVVENYGYHGKALMNQIRREGRVKVERMVRDHRAEAARMITELNKLNTT